MTPNILKVELICVIENTSDGEYTYMQSHIIHYNGMRQAIFKASPATIQTYFNVSNVQGLLHVLPTDATIKINTRTHEILQVIEIDAE